MIKLLTTSDFSQLTGRSIDDVDTVLRRCRISELRYRELQPEELAKLEARVEDVITSEDLRKSGSNDPTVWERGWGEIAASLKDRQIAPEVLRPQYFRGEPTCRLFGRYIRPLVAEFEYDVGLALRQIFFYQFLRSVDAAVEFGCGTGINLLLLSAQMPQTRLIGCDWTKASCQILEQMARQTGHSIKGHLFNMLNAEGWAGDTIDRNTAVFTVHAMEQLGTQWRPFADYLLAKRPALCLHVEPLWELYDDTSLFDDRARRYHLKRGYLRGFCPFIGDLARAGRAEILTLRRIAFGGLFHEAYSILAWRPTN